MMTTATAKQMKNLKFTIVIQKDPQTNLYVGYVPGMTGAHSQGETIQELKSNLII